MTRPLRIDVPSGIYHVVTRGNRGDVIVRDDADRIGLLGFLARAIGRFEWICDAYCVMPTHYHALIRTPKGGLSDGMQYFNGGYAKWFNRRHRLRDHVFGRRFYSALIEGEQHLAEASRYVVLNPVRAGICLHPAEWEWSSYRAAVGIVERPRFLDIEWLLTGFGRELDRAQAAYAQFVRDAPRTPTIDRWL
jgi:putative transposase